MLRADVVAERVVVQDFRWLAGSEDDDVGDFVLVFDDQELAGEGFRGIRQRVGYGEDNDWTIYNGVESRKLSGSG